MSLIIKDLSSDPIVGLIFIGVFILIIIFFVIKEKITGETDHEGFAKAMNYMNVRETTGNKSKRVALNRRRRKLEKENNLPYQSLSHYDDSALDARFGAKRKYTKRK